MDERNILEQRIVTLSGLLDGPNGPNGPLGPAAGALGERLRQSWEAERRLLARILADAQDGDVHTTLDIWTERTSAFLRQQGDAPPTWMDRQGNQWHAEQVLTLLEDIQERLDSWQRADEPLPEDESLGEPA